MNKRADFALLESQKLISRKFWVIEKLWNFSTVHFVAKMNFFPWKWVSWKVNGFTQKIANTIYLEILSLCFQVKSMSVIPKPQKLPLHFDHFSISNEFFEINQHWFHVKSEWQVPNFHTVEKLREISVSITK